MKKQYLIQGIPYVCICICLGIASFYDLSINQYLYHPNSWFGIFFERFALLFITLFVPVAFYARYKIRNSYFSFFAFLIGSIYVCLDAAHFWVDIMEYLPWLIAIACLFSLLFAYGLQSVSLEFWKKYEQYFYYVVTVFLISMSIMLIMKWSWGRVRYREMIGDVSVFTPWYQWNGYTGHLSFPSGHTTAMSVLLCYFDMHRCRHEHPPFWWQYAIVFALILAMMLSRMIMGAHFLSDVTMGFCITYTVFLVVRRRYYREVRR